jgi:major membrane immunogen (membrane-anchored lipoprotein)
MKKWAFVLIAAVAAVSLLAGCGGSQKDSAGNSKKDSVSNGKSQSHEYRDGTYTAKSSPDERGAIGEITLVIEKGRITKADYKGIMKNGKLKDQDYGKTNGKIENQEFYRKAQIAVKAMPSYPAKLLETQSVDSIDAVSGATVSYRQFSEAVKAALKQASPVDSKPVQ